MVTLANAEQSQVKRATRAAYGVTLAELAGEGVPVVAVDADLTGSTTTAKFAKAGYADRLFNCGIAEQNMVDVAAGLATTGNIAFTGSFAVFGTGRAYDQIRNTRCSRISRLWQVFRTCACSCRPTTPQQSPPFAWPPKRRARCMCAWAAPAFRPCTPTA